MRRQPQCIEALVSLAAIHTQQAFSSSDLDYSVVEKKSAKELYDQVLRLFAAEKDLVNEVIVEGAKPRSRSLRLSEVAHDPEMYLEIAKLYSDEANLDRSLKAYKESARVTAELGKAASSMVLNNIGVLEFQKGSFVAAQDKFEESATEVSIKIAAETLTGENDAILTTAVFNLGVVHKAAGNLDEAKKTFDKIVSMHPEFVDG